MNKSERTYGELFALLRDTPQAAAFAPEEIQSLIDQPAETGAPATVGSASAPTGRRIAVVIAALAVSIGGALLVLPVSSSLPDRAAAPAREHRIASAAPARQAVPETSQGLPATVNTPATTSAPANISTPASTASGIGGNQHVVPATSRPAAAADRAPSHSPAQPAATRPSSQTLHIASPVRDNEVTARNLAMSRAAITTLPMLELNPDELRALGVTYNGSEIETAGEEYYSLATDADRTTFAAMGMDTTKRTGIVRMRLIIDGSGLTTKKYAWTRVDTYSHIAPIFALNSPVKDGRNSTVALASFNHSPILDPAKNSNGSTVSTRSKALAADNHDHAAHDSDQANPARILVPVHIRLGDLPIDGSPMRHGSDVILWYYPTPEFAAALPSRYRISLQQELNAMADVVECHLPPGEACRQMTGEPLLLNYCKRNAGALRSLNVAQNPATGELTVNYRLENQRTIVVALYGIHGEFVRELIPAAATDAGAHSTVLQLGQVPSGAYTVVVRSEQGEQVSERLIVQ